MNPFKLRFFAAALAAGLNSIVFGQVKDSGPAIKTQVSFLLVGGASQTKDLFYMSLVGGQPGKVPVAATAVSKSRPTPYDGPQNLTLYVPSPAAAASATGTGPGKTPPPPPPTPVGKVMLPRAEQCLVLLGPVAQAASGQAPGYTAIAVEDDWKTAPAGTLRFLNYSGKTLQAKFDKGMSAILHKGPSESVRIAAIGAEEQSFKFTLVSENPTGGEVVYQNQLKLAGNQRFTIVLVPAGVSAPNGVLATVVREVSPVRLAPGIKPGGPGGPPPPR